MILSKGVSAAKKSFGFILTLAPTSCQHPAAVVGSFTLVKGR
jgi:hypothetical protein